MIHPHASTRGWKLYALALAGIYNIVWGALVVLYPNAFFDMFELPRPIYPVIWQGVGMIIGLYGIAYAIAAFDCFRHWPIVLVGFLGKIFGPIGFFIFHAKGELPFEFFYIHILNDFIWIIPFGIILWKVYMRRKI